MSRVIGIFVALTLAVVLASGCGVFAKKAVDQAAGISVAQEGGTITIKDDKGAILTINPAIADELKNVSVPAGFQVGGGGSMTASGNRVSTATWKGKSTLIPVIDFFKKNGVGQGWTEDPLCSGSNGGLFFYTKAPDLTLQLAVYDKGSGDIEIIMILGKSSTPFTPTPLSAPTKTPTATSTPAASSSTTGSAINGSTQTPPIRLSTAVSGR